MERKATSGTILALIIASTLFLSFNAVPATTAETTENPLPRGFIDAVSTYFEISDSTYLNITLASTEIIHAILESIQKMVSLSIESNSSATSTSLAFSGFEPDKTYYRYQDGNLTESFTTDSVGSYSYIQDISVPHHIFIIEEVATIYIRPNGVVVPSTAPISVSIVDGVYTYTFTANIYETIIVQANNIVIDGDGHTLSSTYLYGFYLYARSSVTIKNVHIKDTAVGILLEMYNRYHTINDNIISGYSHDGIRLRWSSSRNTLKDNTISNAYWGGLRFEWRSSDNIVTGNTVSNNGYGIHSHTYSKNNVFYHNNIINNNVFDWRPADNNWHHPDLLEGNYWSNYPGVDDGSGTGKHAIAGDGIGDTNIPWPSSGFDFYPFTRENGWKIIAATVDIDPDTLNLKSNGEFVTTYIQLPESYDVADIVLETVYLEGIQAITDTTYGFVTDPDSYLLDLDGDGIAETRMVKFDRATVRDTLTDLVDYTEGTKFYDLTLTVTGQLADGTLFEGTDTVVAIKK